MKPRPAPLTFRLDAATRAAVMRAARKAGVSVGELIRVALRAWLERNGRSADR